MVLVKTKFLHRQGGWRGERSEVRRGHSPPSLSTDPTTIFVEYHMALREGLFSLYWENFKKLFNFWIFTSEKFKELGSPQSFIIVRFRTEIRGILCKKLQIRIFTEKIVYIVEKLILQRMTTHRNIHEWSFL